MRLLPSFIMFSACLLSGQLVMATDGPNLPGDENVVHGYVVDANTKKPLAGVVVSVSTNKKSLGREVATNASGYFRLNDLPAGDLALQFDKKGYKASRKEPVSVKPGTVQRLQVDLYTEKLSGESPVVFEHPALRLMDAIF